MINKVIFIGNLGNDPEIRKLENGASVGQFRIATNENYRDKQGNWQKSTEWHNIVVWRWLADKAEKFLKKGSLVYIEGKLTHRSYTDKDGIEKYRTEVVAQVLKILDKRDESEFPGQRSYSDSGNQDISFSSGTTSSTEKDDIPGPDDDLPF